MNVLRSIALTAAVAVVLAVSSPVAKAQVSIHIGMAPACPYGYYDYTPYSCAPYGYYGPEWFHGRVFVGAGPWFRGPSGFRGHVNNNFDRQHGFNGYSPRNGERARRGSRSPRSFRGNEMRDGHGRQEGDHQENNPRH